MDEKDTAFSMDCGASGLYSIDILSPSGEYIQDFSQPKS